MVQCKKTFTFLFSLFLLGCGFVQAQQITVKGKVSDEKEAVVGVNVLVKGTTRGTVTDVNGDYTLNADKGSVLVFQALGYVTQNVTVGDNPTINVTLVADNTQLNEVVVTALGIARDKKSLGYAVTEVKGSDFTQAREINLGNALSGKVAGVNATATATGPGGSSRVLIRGNGSLSGNNQPLYVVNGVPIDNTNQNSAGMWGGFDTGDGLNSINPDDIESISVLKGGTAAALYGSRASNGVILITTKTGKGQKGIGVEYNGTFTMDRPFHFNDWQYEYGQGRNGAKPTSQDEAIQTGALSWGARIDGSPSIQFDGVSRPYTAQRDNVKNFYNNGSTFSNTVAVAGGNDVANFRFSASSLDSKSIIENSGYNRKSFNLSANANLSKKVIFEGVAQYNVEEGKNRTFLSDTPKNPNYGAQLIANTVDIRSLDPGYNAAGDEVRWNSNSYSTNPYFVTNKVRNNDLRNRFLGNFSLRYNVTDHLYIRGRIGTDNNSIRYLNGEPSGIAYETRGTMSRRESQINETNGELIVGFTKDFSNFSVNALVGGNQMRRKIEGLNYNGQYFIVPYTYFLSNTITKTPGYEYSAFGINSLFASADFGYKNLLFLTLTGRQDWFSTLAKDKNSLFYPSAGVSFVLSDALNSKPSWLSYGKVRASIAQVGGGYPSPYALTQRYEPQTNLYINNIPLVNIKGGTIPNAALQPNTSTTTELGIEAKLFNNKLGVDLTLYDRVTKNDPVTASTSAASGYDNVLLNVGEVRNKGIELLLTGTPVRTSGGFNWDVSFNVAYNDNRVERIAQGLSQYELDQSRTQSAYIYHFEGQPYGMITGFKQKTDANGNLVYNSATGLPIQSALMALGRGVPPLTTGITNSFSYKNFSFSFLVDGKFGGKMYSATNYYATANGLTKETLVGREGGVTVRGVDENGAELTKTIKAQDYYSSSDYLRITDRFVYSSDFIKLRQFTFGYSLPKSLLGNVVQSASLSLVARNLLVLYSKVPNVDPESNFSSGNAQGLEMFGVPPARSYGLNLMLKF
ncbi:SusC/RagA family TonB-linked outer membrane protein [Siphonobacter sp. BAB-5405]|uniref:SusC/RagA family TonB-linked outer membrane protein n=1 Tax=Siphonobacter sp. BAB-5405 TaxID=1864825 RepID=UPI000C803894|nr:SusC/RagA family TonB-linked outer membrane protein [Siphonobacter sp. BAB-5405]PMD99386.1 SusC/RagA family TonB-linked outer membrane protein [Siphonobacter sp. BAB-5405]